MAQVLVTGGSGFLGGYVARELRAQGHEVFATFGEHEDRVPQDAGVTPVAMDLGDEASRQAAFQRAWPEAVIHTAALSELKPCEADPERATKLNVVASAHFARMAAALGSRFVFFSTDQVFDGGKSVYAETDAPNPIHAYGRTKAEAEREVRRALPAATVMRVCLVYGPSSSGDRSASEKIVNELRANRRPRLFRDEIRTPVHASDVARAAVAALSERDLPILHCGGIAALSRFEFGVRVARAFGYDESLLESVALAEVDMMPRRPRCLALDSRRMRAVLRCGDVALDERLREDAERK
jgi:dTDP-4-dehydrorhamnose reductase